MVKRRNKIAGGGGGGERERETEGGREGGRPRRRRYSFSQNANERWKKERPRMESRRNEKEGMRPTLSSILSAGPSTRLNHPRRRGPREE